MSNNKVFDIVVIGSGPGGYVAAIRAAQLKQKVLVIEKSDLGGICLNWGCIPTKALLRSSEILTYFRKAKDFGVNNKDLSFSIVNMVNRSRQISKKLSSGIEHLFKKHSIQVLKGKASIKNPNTIKV